MVEQLEFDKDTNVLMCFEDCVEEREQDAGKEHEKPALLPAVTPLKKETLGDDNDCGEMMTTEASTPAALGNNNNNSRHPRELRKTQSGTVRTHC